MYAVAHGLKGFGTDSLRVRVTRIDVASNNVWVVTADLRDAGTPLTLDGSQIEPETQGETLRHVSGLAELSGGAK
jgi:hypothetical protein